MEGSGTAASPFTSTKPVDPKLVTCAVFGSMRIRSAAIPATESVAYKNPYAAANRQRLSVGGDLQAPTPERDV